MSVSIIKTLNGVSTKAVCQVRSFIDQNANMILFGLGILLLSSGLTEVAQASSTNNVGYARANFDERQISAAVGNLFRLVEGSFGALIMVVAGLGAIVAAAMGAYRLAVSMLVVAVGAFILRSLVSIFFGTGYQAYDGNEVSEFGNYNAPAVADSGGTGGFTN